MKTILVVEDNNEIREDICDIFKMEEFHVLEASNGQEGYIKALDHLPDIIISDILMPKLDGFKMYEELKKNALTDCIPIIFLSALCTDKDIRKGINIGADDYLKKPVSPEDLISATNIKLEKYAKNDEKYESFKIDLTNTLHHELNTPLNGIIGFSDYLKERLFEISKEDMKEIVDSLYKSGIRLHKLVEKFLNYSELKMTLIHKSGADQLKKSSLIDTSDIINQVISEIIPLDRSDDLVLSLDAIQLKISKKYFKILLEEMIENAIKFSKKGEKIKITSIINDDQYLLQVINEGKGLKASQIEKIQDFMQFDKKHTVQNGTGIGLSIIQSIADIFTGNLEFNSKQGLFFEVSVSFDKGYK